MSRTTHFLVTSNLLTALVLGLVVSADSKRSAAIRVLPGKATAVAPVVTSPSSSPEGATIGRPTEPKPPDARGRVERVNRASPVYRDFQLLTAKLVVQKQYNALLRCTSLAEPDRTKLVRLLAERSAVPSEIQDTRKAFGYIMPDADAESLKREQQSEIDQEIAHVLDQQQFERYRRYTDSIKEQPLAADLADEMGFASGAGLSGVQVLDLAWLLHSAASSGDSTSADPIARQAAQQAAVSKASWLTPAQRQAAQAFFEDRQQWQSLRARVFDGGTRDPASMSVVQPAIRE